MTEIISFIIRIEDKKQLHFLDVLINHQVKGNLLKVMHTLIVIKITQSLRNFDISNTYSENQILF